MRLQLVDACIVLLAGHFQRYCRNLYDEAAEFLADQVQPVFASDILYARLTDGLQLTRGNAQPASLTTDFKRLGIELWPDLTKRDPRNRRRRERLEQLNVWRNAVAHQDLGIASKRSSLLGSTGRTVQSVRSWRHNCSALAHDLDTVVRQRLIILAGKQPWR